MQQKISDWNKLRDEIHQTAVAHGFWENTPSDEHFLCLVISELMEAVEADRKGKHADQSLLPHFKAPNEYSKTGRGYNGYFEMYVKDTVEDELADAVIRMLDLAGAHDADMSQTECYYFSVSDVLSFTENVFAIVRELVGDRYSLGDKLEFCRAQIFKLAEIIGCDLHWHIEHKILYNSTRDYKHGKLY